MKHILTFVLVLFAISAQAARPDSPFGMKKLSPQVEKLLKETRIYLADAQMRVSASGFPDSAISYSWDGSAWEVDAHVRLNYTASGRVSNMIFYVDAGGTLIPVLRYQYTYDAAGRTTRIELQQTIPGLPPVVASRFTMNYDVQGNQTSMLVYELDNNALVLMSGDSLQITYAGGVPTTATQYYWDESAPVAAWTPGSRFSNITLNANGQPTALIISRWDSTAFVQEERITEASWKMGYPGFSLTFGGLLDIGSFLFQELPASFNFEGEPTDYIAEIFDNNNWVLDYRYVSTGAVGAISQVLEQERSNNAWVDSYRVTFTYNANRLTQSLNENMNGTTWEPSYRHSWSYDAQGNLLEEKEEFHTGTSWQIDFADRNTFSYTPDNKVYRWIGEEWDFNATAYVNYLKRDYFFGAFPQSVTNQKLAQLQVYPNPVQDVLNIALEAAGDGKLSAEIFNLQGQLVASQIFTLSPGKNQLQFEVQTLAKGLYQLRLQSASGLETVRFVK